LGLSRLINENLSLSRVSAWQEVGVSIWYHLTIPTDSYPFICCHTDAFVHIRISSTSWEMLHGKCSTLKSPTKTQYCTAVIDSLPYKEQCGKHVVASRQVLVCFASFKNFLLCCSEFNSGYFGKLQRERLFKFHIGLRNQFINVEREQKVRLTTRSHGQRAKATEGRRSNAIGIW
jgi:hypothetical protein